MGGGEYAVVERRIGDLDIRREKMKEKRLMTDVGTLSIGEDLLGVIELITGPLWRSRGGQTHREVVDGIEARILSIFSLKNDPNWEDICRYSSGE